MKRTRAVTRWACRAPADRLSLPAAVAVYGAGELLHVTGIPVLDAGIIGCAAVPGLVYGLVSHSSHKLDPRARKIRPARAAGAALAAGVWMTAAARWGAAAGPAALSTVLYAGGTGIGYAVLRHDEEVARRRTWRDAKTRWHTDSAAYGLSGSHLLSSEATRLGRVLTVDVRGTGKRASQLACRDTEERIAEARGMRPQRVMITTDTIAGRIRISLREKDPWAAAIPHPVLDENPEIELPRSQSILDPLIVGQDPETGKPLTITLYDEDGVHSLLIVAIRGGGKTVLLSCIMERLTACRDVLVFDINLSKGKENRRWAPACHLTAHGPHEKAKALKILRMARKIVEFRGASDSDNAVHIPTPQDPAIVVRVDEMDALQGGQDPISQAIRDELNKINSKSRSEGVILIEAGQRGVTTHSGSADIRANFDMFALAKVRSQAEMTHAAGDLGLELPDMTKYGEGHAGVWLLAELGGGYSIGRTFKLKELGDISAIATQRRPEATLPPALVEYLGDAYEALRTGQAVAHPPPGALPPAGETGAQPAGAPAGPDVPAWMAELDKEMTGGMEGELIDQLDRISGRNARTRRALDDLTAQELPEIPPGQEAAVAAAIAERTRQAALTVDIPDDHRSRIMAMLQGAGASSGDIAKALGVDRTTIWRYLARLRAEGAAHMTGKGRGATWHAGEAAA